MALVKLKPTSPGRRHAVKVVTPGLHKGKISPTQKEFLLQDWKFYQHIGNALSNEAERNRSGKYLYTKYRCSAYDFHDSFHLFRNE